MLTVGELFAGIGGFGLGLERTGGFKVSWQVENDSFALKVLKKHWPEVRRHDDVCTFPPTAVDEWKVDLICAGFPCQDISAAGKGAGLKGERSGLFYEVVRITERLQPRYLLLENVAALLVRGLDEVLGSLAEIGFDTEWHCIPAAAVGAPHRRDRAFVLAYSPSLGIQRLREPGKQVSPAYARPQIPLRCGSGSRGSFWQTEPDVDRVVNGFSRGLDRTRRIKALGNAVVPQVVEVIANQILNWERSNGKNATH